jgi:hypothetical protein
MSARRLARLHRKSSSLAIEMVEKQARRVLARNRRSLQEFVMGMGTWFFTDQRGRPVDPPRSAAGLKKFFDEWGSVYSLTGVPMRFTATGKAIRDW